MSNVPSSQETSEPTAAPLMDTAKGLTLSAMSGLPYPIAMENPDKNTYFTFAKGGLSYGALFMDNKLELESNYGVTDAMLLAVVHHRYSELAKIDPTMKTVVDKLDAVLREVHEIEVRLVEVAKARQEAAAELLAQQQAAANAAE